LDILRITLLVATLLVATYTDLSQRKIYNWNTFPAIGLGFGLALGEALSEESLHWLWPSLVGFALSALVFGLPFLMSWLGGGDFKLMLGIGALQGAPMDGLFLAHAIYNISLVGAIMALLMLIWKGRLLAGLRGSLRLLVHPKTSISEEREQLPYGLAISVGTLWTLWGVLG
jgi:prepilin peptidase CpaA